ncbi:hypothetical protein [Luteibacter aegosomatissinici]|uniref:hypothetical protein n=1 Tax=Luteibacter aegosomatissinici TaxID=2911539 RepID=UPI001FFB0E07|nr:hypothetical protein [Luteibacter aegosomatissinici]UPG96574.1 hypothetical protein L2Y97_10785 [Luteibacter aegosomatissinici]
MPHSRYPRVVGFEVPVLNAGRVPADTPLVALLDTVPTPNWVRVFEREAQHLKKSRGLVALAVEEDRVVVTGEPGDPRELTKALRSLIERVTQVRMDERLRESANQPHGV